jgi:hypothetical protein
MHKDWGLDHINQESRDIVAQDSVMQCKHLLALTTGSELLPSNPRQRIGVSLPSVLIIYSTLTLLFQVQFIHQLPDEFLYQPKHPEDDWKVGFNLF